MNEQPPFDETVDHPPAGASIVPSLAANLPQVPRVHLREPLIDGLTPVNLPDSPEMPEVKSPSGFPPRLQLLGEIARGGMGSILKGRDVDLGRDLAVKVLLEEHRGKSELTQRFIEEAQIAGQLQHPGITPVHELGIFADGRPYFTMKLVKGQTLSALLATRKDVLEDRPRFLGVFAQVCQTLAYAHARGVIHRDLKPSNAMVGAFGEVQVMDWGLAKVLSEGGVADELRSRARERAENVSVIRTARSQDAGTPEVGSHTQAGTLLGTPAYMAPEQARGEVELVDERADVFGLGAILCEILTGQPPYVGKGAEIQYKARTAKLDDAYQRLASCGADAELIALAKRCLAAEPWDRPRHAGEVSERLTAYQNAVTERLRQAELTRAAEEARAIEARATASQERKARRMTLALAASVLLTILSSGGGWLWLRGQRAAQLAENNRAINEALIQATGLRDQARTAQERTALDLAARAREQARRAEALVESGPADAALSAQLRGLLAELDADEKDRQLLAELDAARLAQADTNAAANTFTNEQAIPLFRKAFRVYGMVVGEGEAAAVAARLGERPAAVREAVLAAVDEWLALAENQRLKGEEPHLAWLRALLAAAEPEGWEKQIREAAVEKEPAKRRAALEKLAAAADVKRLPARALTRLAEHLQSVRDEAGAVALLRRAQLRHAGDFWINERLGWMLQHKQPAEAVPYLTAAVALRPDSAGARLNLGNALRDQGKRDEAIAEYRKAIEIDPKYAQAHLNLGFVLHAQGKRDEAIAEYKKAIELNPKNANTQFSLGNALKDQGKRDEAIVAYRKVIEIDPKYAQAHNNLGLVLNAQGKQDEAIAAYRKAITLDPKLAEPHDNLGSHLSKQGKLDEAIAEYRKAIELDPKSAMAHYRLGNALMDQGKRDEAIVAYRKVIEIDPKYAQAHANLGLVLNAQGKQDEAIAAYRKAITLDPKLFEPHANLGLVLNVQGKRDEAIVECKKAIELNPKLAALHANLGLVLKGLGKVDEAIAEYRKTIELDPKDAETHCSLGSALFRQGRFAEAAAALKRGHELGCRRPGWSYPSARWLRDAEQAAALAPKLAAFLRGDYQPRDNAERLGLAKVCVHTKHYAAASRLYDDAFAADTKLADDLKVGHRYNAACYTALAAAGHGEEAKKLDDKERSRWRKQALGLLRADLAAYGKFLNSGKLEDRKLVQQQLQHWRQDSDLAGIRDKDAVAQLPADEREACRKLWTEVETLLAQARQAK